MSQQISIFPATSVVASTVRELLLKHHPQVIIQLASRSCDKLAISNDRVKIVEKPLLIDRADSIKAALEGSESAFIMNPPFHGATDPFSLSDTFISSIIEAANSSPKLKKIVFLSSMAAEKPSGNGIVRTLHLAESALLTNLREGIEVISLRPANFLSNFKQVLALSINPPHILPSMQIPFTKAFPFIDAKAIAEKAVNHLINPNLTHPQAAKKRPDHRSPTHSRA